ncbi:hypothetical protein [Microbacterium binotii]|uniref:Secreted protein n=1 Tax=Microbacterium binotii TaxID=462710 RepID=A0ABP6BTQ4_9MICO
MTPRRRLLTPISLLAAALALAGCTSVGSYTDLESTETRALPDAVTEDARANLDLDSMRWVGQYEGTDVWLARGSKAGEICIFTYPGDGAWASVCGGEGGELGVSGPDQRVYMVVPDGGDSPEGSIAVSHNVYVRPLQS